MATLAQDTFIRSNQSGWGTASDGKVWSHTGSQTETITSNQGTMNGGFGIDVMLLGSGTAGTCEASVRVLFDASGDGVWLILRAQDSSNYYAFGCGIDYDSYLEISKFASGSSNDLGHQFFGPSSGTEYWIKANANGSTLKLKMWAAGGTEPDWMITVTDSSYSSGQYGIGDGLRSNSVTPSVDSYLVTDGATTIPLGTPSRSVFKTKSALITPGRSNYVTRAVLDTRSRSKFSTRVPTALQTRGKFSTSTALKQTGRNKFVTRAVINSTSRAKFSIRFPYTYSTRGKFSTSMKGNQTGRSKFVSRTVLDTRSRSTFNTRFPSSLTGSRAKFSTRWTQSLPTRGKFSIREVMVAAARSTFKILNNLTSLVVHTQAKFATRVTQKQSGRARFWVRWPMTLAERSRFSTRYPQQQATRSKFVTRLVMKSLARSRFYTRMVEGVQARSKFVVPLILRSIAQAKYKTKALFSTATRSTFSIRWNLALLVRSRFSVRMRMTTKAQDRYTTRLYQVARALSNFRINIGSSFPHALKISLVRGVTILLAAFSSISLRVSFVSSTMPSPFSTTQIIASVTDYTGVAQPSLSAVNVSVLFPDGSTGTYSLGSGVTNTGNGNYRLIYTTKGPGLHKETWNLTNSDGTTAEFINVTPVSF